MHHLPKCLEESLDSLRSPLGSLKTVHGIIGNSQFQGETRMHRHNIENDIEVLNSAQIHERRCM